MAKKRGGVTVWDVAKAADVSAQTVSRVVSGRGYSSEETRSKVLAAVEQLGYKPNVIGKSLRSTRSPMIGLVVADISNPFYARLHRALERELRDSGLTVFLLNCDDDADREAQQLELLASYRPTGLVISPAAASRFDAQDVTVFSNVVLVSRTLPDLAVPTVQTNESDAFAAAAEELLSQGHERIAAILGRPDVSTTQLRKRGLQTALEQHQGCTAQIRFTDGTAAHGLEVTAELLRDAGDITGIIGFNGPVTEGVLEAIRTAGLNCPADVSVAGFTDAGWMRASHPSITAVSQPVEEMGRMAGQIIKRLVAGDAEAMDSHLIVPGALIRRESVRPPKKGIVQ